MRLPFKTLAALCAMIAVAALAAKEKTRDETLILDKSRVTITVPDGYVYSSGRTEQGAIVAKIADAKEKINLQVEFQPDPASRLGAESQQMEFLANICRQYAEDSVQKGYDFKPLEPRHGSGTYCTFTDASLLGKLPVPKGEFLHITQGVKCWNGWVLVFTLLTNDLESKEYQTALKLVKESFEEAPPAPKS